MTTQLWACAVCLTCRRPWRLTKRFSVYFPRWGLQESGLKCLVAGVKQIAKRVIEPCLAIRRVHHFVLPNFRLDACTHRFRDRHYSQFGPWLYQIRALTGGMRKMLPENGGQEAPEHPSANNPLRSVLWLALPGGSQQLVLLVLGWGSSGTQNLSSDLRFNRKQFAPSEGGCFWFARFMRDPNARTFLSHRNLVCLSPVLAKTASVVAPWGFVGQPCDLSGMREKGGLLYGPNQDLPPAARTSKMLLKPHPQAPGQTT